MVVLFLVALSAWTPAESGAMERGIPSVAQVERAMDGDTLRLEDGREVQLLDIQAPAEGGVFRTLAEKARKALAQLVEGREVEILATGEDRHGRLMAEVRSDGHWVAEELVRNGWFAFILFPAPGENRVAVLLALEAAARAAGRGLWQERAWTVCAPEETERRIGTFQVVEGRVVAANKVGGRIYLNFGTNWRTDFTVVISPGTRRLFERAGIDPLAWQGHRIRVRGWLDRRNSPEIELTHPQQVEPIPENPEERTIPEGEVALPLSL